MFNQRFFQLHCCGADGPIDWSMSVYNKVGYPYETPEIGISNKVPLLIYVRLFVRILLVPKTVLGFSSSMKNNCFFRKIQYICFCKKNMHKLKLFRSFQRDSGFGLKSFSIPPSCCVHPSTQECHEATHDVSAKSISTVEIFSQV